MQDNMLKTAGRYLITWFITLSVVYTILIVKNLPEEPSFSGFLEYLLTPLAGERFISFHYGDPITVILREKFTNTLAVMIPSLALGIPLGFYLGHRVRQFLPVLLICSLASVPFFWLGMIFISIAIRGSWAAQGNMLLTVFTAFLYFTAIVAADTRNNFVSLQKEMTQTFYPPISKNGEELTSLVLLKVLQQGPYLFLFGLGGYLLLELVMGWPGLGRELIQGIILLDFPLLGGAIAVIITICLICNLSITLLTHSYHKKGGW